MTERKKNTGGCEADIRLLTELAYACLFALLLVFHLAFGGAEISLLAGYVLPLYPFP